jgi:hypothetical protein
MTRYLIYYAFHRIDSVSLNHLVHLKKMNPDAIIIPRIGIQQSLYFPTVIYPTDKYVTMAMTLEWMRPSTIKKVNQTLSRKVESIRRRTEITALRKALKKMDLELYCDFTPLAWFNMDLSIRNWFIETGKNYDFDQLLYFEYDVFLTKTVEEVYEKYANFDAGFADYELADPSWVWSHWPPGSSKSVQRWLKKQNQKLLMYHGFVPGLMVSRKALSRSSEVEWPFAVSELRMPTVLTGLGLSCVELDFPMLRFRPGFSKKEIKDHNHQGIFHPVYEVF